MYFNRFDIVNAHYMFCVHHHTGQGSPEYHRLCRILTYYRPSGADTRIETMTTNARAIYDQLVELHNR